MEKTVIAEGIICIVFVLLLSINGCAHVPLLAGLGKVPKLGLVVAS